MRYRYFKVVDKDFQLESVYGHWLKTEPWLRGLDLFIHPILVNHSQRRKKLRGLSQWTITEAYTGHALVEGRTKKEAVENARKVLGRFSMSDIHDTLAKAIADLSANGVDLPINNSKRRKSIH